MGEAPATASPFLGFWQGGYEGADHVNRAGLALSMNEATGHLARIREDYLLLREVGIMTVRESIGWRLAERGGRFDFSSALERARAARELGMQVCWTLCHYGWPDDVDVYAPHFVERFARYCRAAAQALAPYAGETPVYSPINEISFTAWGLSVHLFVCKNMHDERAHTEAKRQLVRAAIAGCDAIRAVSPGARFLHCDPVINVVAPAGQPELVEQAAAWTALQFEAWDMLAGLRAPELGGHPRYLDLVGANYYEGNQWEGGTNLRLWWHLADPRRIRLHRLLIDVHRRYGRPVLLAETSHVGSGRGTWIREMAQEAALATQNGVDVLGICLYPVIDRPDWEDQQFWHHSGLWDVDAGGDRSTRILNRPYAAALRQAQSLTERLCTTTNQHDPSGKEDFSMPAIIVFCHLRWDFVYQRPQQLLTRLARHYRIIFVEEPVFHDGASFMKTSTPAPNVTVCQPHTPVHAGGFHDDQLALLQPLLAGLVPDDDDPIVWFYTPMALPLLQQLHPGLVVYDCMDELSAFKNPPRQLLQRESALLKIADLVFTGGPSLHAAKRRRHAHAHCFPSSVDAIHFEQALDRSNHHPLQDAIPGPRLGFYGVIDERFDTALIAGLADAHANWQLVLVGPVVKIDQASLPRRANIHYLGQQSYQALPQFLAGWDVCLLPFALNDATRFISPTKVLEYMAAGLPIVSTPITDVAVPYGDVVAIAETGPAFVAACENALAMSPAARDIMRKRMAAIVAATSWEATAEQMRTLLEAALPARAADVTAAEVVPVPMGAVTEGKVNALRTAAAANGAATAVGCVIVGAGPTGLSAAYHLGADTVLLERHASVGGWCRSIEDGGFTFDYAGHIMFSNDPYVLQLYDILLGDNQHWQNREAWVYSKQVYTRYPFQGALYGLPPSVIKECIVGAIEARYGVQAGTSPADMSQAGMSQAAAPQNFEEFIYQVWGAGIARHFAIPYNRKLWTVPLRDMETSWLGGRVPLPNLPEIIEGALEPVGKPMGPNARFGYPKKGGFQALVSGFLPHLKGELALNADAVQLLPQQHLVVLADGRRYRYDQLVSTMPLPELVKLIGADAPGEVRAAAHGLNHVSIRCVNIGIGRPAITDKHWIYYPEDAIFHRIFVQGNASPECNAPGGFGFTCEISYSPWKPLPLDGDALISRCLEDCIKVGFITADDTVLVANQVDMPYAYVVYDHDRARHVATIRAWMEQHDITLSGRYSEWEYYNSDHAFLAGKKAAETVETRIKARLSTPTLNASGDL
jgi:protoporphyrinogen oxidase/glycosyltransferase involved in cell wall biosynthesis